MNELPVVIDRSGTPLVGILHRSAGAPEQGVLMMVAGGPQYRIGGHRQLVLWARQFAAHGFPTLRFDFSGMGDSYGGFLDFENSEDDIRAAIDRLFIEQPTLKRIVLWGECNACSASLFYAYKDPRITGIVMLNPWVRTAQGKAKTVVKHYYLQRLRERSFWAKVFSLKFDPSESLRSALQMIRLARGQGGGQGKAGRPEKAERRSLPERMFDGLVRFDGRIMLIMSGRDLISREFDDLLHASPAWREQLAARAAVRHDLEYADHTFSSGEWRDRVAQWGVDWLSALPNSRDDRVQKIAE